MEELERRCRANARYSMRSFARALSISPSALSMVLNGERGLSLELATAISKKLGLDPTSSAAFIGTAIRRRRTPQTVQPASQSFNQLTLDQFGVISEWYHFAILSLITTKEFRPELPWIASRLGITQGEARAAVERLVRLKVLDVSQKKWKQVGNPIFVNNTESTAATRQHQKQILEKATYSLENDSMELREMNSVTIAIDPKQVGIAKRRIAQFLMDLMNELESQSTPKEVYHLSTQLYPVSKNRGN